VLSHDRRTENARKQDMNTRSLRTFAVALPLLGLASCASLFSGSNKSGLSLVDQLLSQVEGVHVEAVLSRERMKDALESLHDIVSPGFQGDALAAFAIFEDAVNRSEQQASRLENSMKPMQRSADEIFNRWNENLAAITSESMRRHSQERLFSTRERYEVILAELEPALAGYQGFNRILRDHALFLSNDYNAAAVAEIEREVSDLLVRARDLDVRFQTTQAACEEYVRSSALRGQEQLSRNKSGFQGGGTVAPHVEKADDGAKVADDR
jgi:hypothetical protein